tara:strand:- start:97 stop:1188 length:1092 start_codon:yes stop_codon:yes gene_type:complete
MSSKKDSSVIDEFGTNMHVMTSDKVRAMRTKKGTTKTNKNNSKVATHVGGSYMGKMLGYSSEKIANCLITEFKNKYLNADHKTFKDTILQSLNSCKDVGGGSGTTEIKYKLRTKINEEVLKDIHDIVTAISKLRCTLFQQKDDRHGHTVQTNDNDHLNYNNYILCDKKEIALNENTAHNLLTTLIPKIMELKILKDKRTYKQQIKKGLEAKAKNVNIKRYIDKKAAFQSSEAIANAKLAETKAIDDKTKAEQAKDEALKVKDEALKDKAKAQEDAELYKIRDFYNNFKYTKSMSQEKKKIIEKIKEILNKKEMPSSVEELKKSVAEELNKPFNIDIDSFMKNQQKSRNPSITHDSVNSFKNRR